MLLLLALIPAVTTTASATSFAYDERAIARVDTREVYVVEAASPLVNERPEVSASPSIEARGTSTTPFTLSYATRAGTDLVRYGPEWASRQMLGQNTPGSSGYGVTPGGRTLSAHAAERISVGGPGRPPTSLSTVDEILDTGTSIRFDPVRDSIQVRAPQMPGKPYVVVDSGGTHIVTVMVPK
jgi:hypothetical protein